MGLISTLVTSGAFQQTLHKQVLSELQKTEVYHQNSTKDLDLLRALYSNQLTITETPATPAGVAGESWIKNNDKTYWPVKSKVITSYFGYRKSPGGIGSRDHKGVDFGEATGTPVYAWKNGTVVFAGATQGGYGNRVEILHENRQLSTYNHLSSYSVKQGQKILGGSILGKVGSTGNSTGPHLHFEIKVNNNFVDPLILLKQAIS
jgi:murein DD-endopeptidase MepM/ murein hydrolase activator NlpD